MYISGTDKKSYMNTACVYLAVSAFCAVFGEVYEHFSHNVYSAYMVFAFAFPLAGGALLFGYFLICAAYVKNLSCILFHTVSLVRGRLFLYI